MRKMLISCNNVRNIEFLHNHHGSKKSDNARNSGAVFRTKISFSTIFSNCRVPKQRCYRLVSPTVFLLFCCNTGEVHLSFLEKLMTDEYAKKKSPGYDIFNGLAIVDPLMIIAPDPYALIS